MCLVRAPMETSALGWVAISNQVACKAPHSFLEETKFLISSALWPKEPSCFFLLLSGEA